MATGVPKTRWKRDLQQCAEVTNSDITLSYQGKAAEEEILSTFPAKLREIWSDSATATNRLYYGDNLPILAALLNDPLVKGHVKLIYIDPPFATNSVFQSHSQEDSYQDLLTGSDFIG